LELYHLNNQPGWHWFEEVVTYSNASLPHALLKIGPFMPAGESRKMMDSALDALGWLVEIQMSAEGNFSPVGTAGFYPRGGAKARFDQQPLEAANMVAACLDAHHITGDEQWLHAARMAFGWFLGKNDLNLPLVDMESGGCCDGLHPDRVNRNQGAESTLAYLRALLAMHSLEQALKPANREMPGFSFLKLLPKASGGLAHDRGT
jgi:hypothetical protein